MTTQITSENYYTKTNAHFRPVCPKMGQKYMRAILEWRRKRNKPEFIEVDGEKWTVDHQSQSKNALHRSRSNSFYLTNGKSVVRISDHWSASKYDRSHKFNCGMISTCYWTNREGERFSIFLPGERYESSMIAGIVDFDKMETY